MARPHSTSIGSELIRVVAAAALPVWVAAALLLYKVHADDRTLVERDAATTARVLTAAVDRDVAAARATAIALATSPYLVSGDLAAFHQQASRVLASGTGSNIILTDASGQQVLNTLRDYGQSLPRHGDPDLVRRVVDGGRPVISDLYHGGVRHLQVVSIDVPVMRGEQIVYDLSVGLLPERLNEILREEALPAGWTASILDSKGVIVARTEAGGDPVGHKAAPALVSRMAQVPEGSVEAATMDSTGASAVFTHSRLSGWTVAVEVPADRLTTLWRSLASGLAITLLLAGSLTAARWAGRRVVQPLQALGMMAVAYGRGERVEIPPLGLKEADDLAGSLIEGSRLLETRTIERDRAETQRQQTFLAKQLGEEAAHTRSAYFAYLSHELRSPLMAILGCSELIAARMRAKSIDQDCLKYCWRIENTVDHLVSVINEILDFAKFEARELEIHKEWLDVSTELAGVEDLMEGRARQCGVELRRDVEPDLPLLNVDRIRLRQILLNVVSNALKFTPAGGTVVMQAARSDDGWLVIRVRDTGIGIGPDDLPRIMQPFAQAPVAQPGKRGGTGLGLPLTKALVELHGGSFDIASTPGEGTIVTVRLPVQAQAVNAADRCGLLKAALL